MEKVSEAAESAPQGLTPAASGIILLSRKNSHTSEKITDIHLWDGWGDFTTPLWSTFFPATQVTDVVYSALFNRLILSCQCGRRGLVNAWDLNSGLLIYSVEDLSFRTSRIAINPSETKFLTTAPPLPGIMVWDAGTGVRLSKFPTTDYFRVAAFTMNSPTEDRIVTLQDSGRLLLLNAETGAELSMIDGFGIPLTNILLDGSIGTLALDKESSLVAAAVGFGEYELKLRIGVWDYSTGERLLLIDHDRFGQMSLADSNTLLCLSSRDICAWDVRSSSVRFRIAGYFMSWSRTFVEGGSSIVVIKSRDNRRCVCKLDVATGDTEEHSVSTDIPVERVFCVASVTVLL
jgi:hypothetical protein